MNRLICHCLQLIALCCFTNAVPAHFGKLSNFLMSACLNSCKNGVCHRVNEHSIFSEVTCKCLAGFEGFHCSKPVCKPACLHGNCIVESGEQVCKCLPGYFGPTCHAINWNFVLGFFQKPNAAPPAEKKNVTFNPVVPQGTSSACADNFVCRNGGHCTKSGNGVKCNCVGMYIGTFCQDKCMKSCLNNGRCYLDQGVARCNCTWGFNGEFCERAVF